MKDSEIAMKLGEMILSIDNLTSGVLNTSFQSTGEDGNLVSNIKGDIHTLMSGYIVMDSIAKWAGSRKDGIKDNISTAMMRAGIDTDPIEG